MLKIPYAIADYARLRREQFFFVDRTNYIELLETYGTSFPMFLRPRRFGKSLIISLLAHYYDVNHADNFQQLFGGLHIGKNPTPLANQYLILQFDFSGIETMDAKQVHEAFLKKVKDGVQWFLNRYAPFCTPTETELILSQTIPAGVMVEFFNVFKKIKRTPIYVLVDEYDQFTNELLSFHFAEFKEIVSQNGYVRKFYEVLKTEAGRGSIARIFLTGVAPVTVDSMTSGFNIMTDLSLSTRFHNMMGFTEVEVLDLLHQLGITGDEGLETLTHLRNWYNGYCFNLKHPDRLYNPEMVLYFASYYQREGSYPDKMLTANVATDYQKIAQIFRIGNQEETGLTYLSTFLETGEINSYLTDRFNVAVGFGVKEIWSMLFYTGMTTLKSLFGNNYTFQMPNYVIKSLYYDYFVALHLGMAYGTIQYEIRDSIEELVRHGHIEPFTRWVGHALQKAHSNRDNIAYNEKHLKTLVVGLLFPYENYLIRSEYEVEKRYIDIFLERIPQVNIKHEILLELKYIKKENGDKWVDKDEKMVDPPAPPKKVSKTRTVSAKLKTKVAPPTTPLPIPVKPLLDHVVEKGTIQLNEYMQLNRFQRPDLLGFCLVYIGCECRKIIPYTP